MWQNVTAAERSRIMSIEDLLDLEHIPEEPSLQDELPLIAERGEI